MRHVSLGAAVALCLVGCASSSYPTHYQVYIDPAFGDRVDDVLHALDVWQDALGLEAVQFDVAIRDYTADVGDDAIITIHPDTLSDIRAKGHSSTFIGATVGWQPYTGWGDSYVEQKFLPWTILHEIGHGLGLEHTGAGTLMYKDLEGASPTITCADANQYLTRRGISPRVCH